MAWRSRFKKCFPTDTVDYDGKLFPTDESPVSPYFAKFSIFSALEDDYLTHGYPVPIRKMRLSGIRIPFYVSSDDSSGN